MPRYSILTELEATPQDRPSELGKPLAPFGRVPRSMEHGVDGYDVPGVLVENGERKAADQSPAVGFMNYSAHLRTPTDGLNTCIDTA